MRLPGKQQPVSINNSELERDEDLMRLFFNSEMFGMTVYSPDKGWLLINDTYCEMLGYSREELMGLSFSDITHPDDLHIDRELYRDMLAGKCNSYSMDKRCVRKKGEIIEINISLDCKRNKDGRVEYIFGFIQDNTYRKQVEQDLKQSEIRYRNLLESAIDGMLIVNSLGEIEIVNKALESLTGYKRSELIRKPIEFLVPERFSDHKHLREDYLATPCMLKIGDAMDIFIRHKNGNEIPVEISLNPLMMEDGLIVSVLVRDITERKKSEDEIIQAHDRMRKLAARLYDAREIERTRIAREIHDELGQSLTGLKMDLFNLLNSPRNNKHGYPERVQSMVKLLDTTIDFVRKLSSSIRPAMLDDLGLEAAIEWQLQGYAKRTNCTYKLDLADKVHGAEKELESEIFRIFQEALTNIARHAEATHVEVSLKRVGPDLVLQIIDNGKGIDEDKLSDNNSVGIIGMRERASVYGGTIDFKRVNSGGTEVKLTMPVSWRHT